MKNKLFFAIAALIILASSIYLYSCQKEHTPKLDAVAQETNIENNVVDRAAPFCNVWFTVVSGNSANLRSCGFGFNGQCGTDCSGNAIFGTKLITQTGSTGSFPKRFAVTNNGSTSATVNINWSCGPYFCGGTLSNVVVPAGEQKVFVLTNNGSVCACQPDECE